MPADSGRYLGYALACWEVSELRQSGTKLKFVLTSHYDVPNPNEAYKDNSFTANLTHATLIGSALFVQLLGSRVDRTFGDIYSQAISDITPLLPNELSSASPTFEFQQTITDLTNSRYDWITVDIGWVRVFANPDGTWYYQWLQTHSGDFRGEPNPCLKKNQQDITIGEAFFAYWPLAERDTTEINYVRPPGTPDKFYYVPWLKSVLSRKNPNLNAQESKALK